MANNVKRLPVKSLKPYLDVKIVRVGYAFMGLMIGGEFDNYKMVLSEAIKPEDYFTLAHLSFESLKDELSSDDLVREVKALFKDRIDPEKYPKLYEKIVKILKRDLREELHHYFAGEHIEEWELAGLLRTDQVAFVKKIKGAPVDVNG